MSWLLDKLGYGPDPEIEAARRRNELRDLGEEIKKDRIVLEQKRAREHEIYRFALQNSKGDPRSPFGKQAVAVRKGIADIERQIAALDARLRPIEQTLATACQRQRDSRMSQLMQEVVTDEKRSSNPALRRDLGRVLASAKSLTDETRGIQDDLNGMPLGEPDDDIALQADFAADYNALHSESMSSATDTEADAAAAAMIERRRNFPAWSPPVAAAAIGSD